MKKIIKICRDFSRRMKEDNLNSFASSCAFFIFLSIVPMVLLLFAILPYTPVKPQLIIDFILNEFPAGTGNLLVSILSDASEKSIGLVSISAITTLWAAGKGVNALIAGFNAIDRNVDKRNGILLRIVSSLYTLIFLVGIVVILVLVVGGNVILNVLEEHFPQIAEFVSVFVNLKSVISIVLMSIIFMLCFSLLPCKKHKFRETFPGAILASLTWTGFSYLFSFYVEKFNAFSMYGSLTTIIVLLFWLYMCMYILLIGCNLNKYFSPVIKALTTKGVSVRDVKGQLESLEED